MFCNEINCIQCTWSFHFDSRCSYTPIRDNNDCSEAITISMLPQIYSVPCALNFAWKIIKKSTSIWGWPITWRRSVFSDIGGVFRPQEEASSVKRAIVDFLTPTRGALFLRVQLCEFHPTDWGATEQWSSRVDVPLIPAATLLYRL